MSTQYMPSPFYGHQQPPAGGYSNYPSGKNGGFAFSKRVERVDWRKVAAIDVDAIARTLDFTTLQENIMNITFCNLEAELDIRSVDPNFVKLFKLAQLTIEYLLHSQEYLAGLCSSLEEKCKQTEQEVETTKKEVESLKKELDDVKKESHKRKKLLIAQQQLMFAGNESYNKCPFCAKAFLNNSYLQSHITRRHSAGINNNKDGSSSVSPDLGVGSENTPNNQLESELIQIKERLLKQEAELHEERMKYRTGKIVSAKSIENAEEGEDLAPGVSSAIMKELRELNAKYQASQTALRELELRTGSKRSNLGDLEDDIENEKELLKEQKEGLKEQLQQQLNHMESFMQVKLEKQERKWQKRVHKMTQLHMSEIKKLSSVLESTSRSLDHSPHPRDPQQKQEVEEILRMSREQEKALEIQEQELEREISRASEVKPLKSPHRPKRHTPRGTTPRGTTPRGMAPQHDPVIKHSSMYPSDDDEDETAFGTGTSSLKTIGHDTGHTSTMGQTGTESLHASQFLEELRRNPTLAVMREEFAAFLQEHVEKRGIPAGQTGISDQVLKNKLAMLETQRQANEQKYLNFMHLREHFNRLATEKAKKLLRQQTMSPRGTMPPSAGPRRRLDMSPHTPRQQVPSPSRHAVGPPHPQQHLSSGRASPHSPHPRPVPRGSGPQTPNNRPKTPLSTGSTTEWTSTQFDSDEDSEDDYEEESLSRGGAAFKPSPGARLIQSGPARNGPSPRRPQSGPSPRTQQGPKPRVIQSKPLNNNAVNDDIDDLLDSEGEEPQGRVAGLRHTIEGQLGGRNAGTKPFGGVDVSGGKPVNSQPGNFDEESDWDDTTAPNDAQPQVVLRRPAVRASTDGMSTNTYGTSAWGGSSSKAASTVKDKERRSTSRSSFASVTSVSSDEDMNVDNI